LASLQVSSRPLSGSINLSLTERRASRKVNSGTPRKTSISSWARWRL
jgi:hypothetical protein